MTRHLFFLKPFSKSISYFHRMRLLYKFFFSTIAGWKIEGDVPRNLNKYIIAVAPHTSNWDFLIGLAVRSIKGFKSNFLGKKELFRAPYGWIFRKLGGYPVDRSKQTNMVDQVADIIRKEDHFVVAIAPEGTRKNVTRWKTGFYHMAYKGGIPIVFASFDYPSKKVMFSSPFYPSGDFAKDAHFMEDFFKGKRGVNREIAPII